MSKSPPRLVAKYALSSSDDSLMLKFAYPPVSRPATCFGDPKRRLKSHAGRAPSTTSAADSRSASIVTASAESLGASTRVASDESMPMESMPVESMVPESTVTVESTAVSGEVAGAASLEPHEASQQVESKRRASFVSRKPSVGGAPRHREACERRRPNASAYHATDGAPGSSSMPSAGPARVPETREVDAVATARAAVWADRLHGPVARGHVV